MATVVDAPLATAANPRPTEFRTRRADAGARRESLLFLYAPFTLGVLLSFSRTPDDAFITLRYARNLLLGSGAVFDIGQHVQGFSSPLHLLVSLPIAAIPHGHALL